jgi:hypothetical protein
MGGFKYNPSFSSDFMKGADKDALIASGDPFEIKAIRFSESGQYGPQYYLKVALLSGEEKTMSFSADGKVYTRDDLLEQAMTFLKTNKNETLIARLSKEGQTNIVTIEDD